MEKEITRKDFLLKSSKAAVGITAIAGASSLLTTATVKGKTTLTPCPGLMHRLILNQSEFVHII